MSKQKLLKPKNIKTVVVRQAKSILLTEKIVPEHT